MKCFSRQGEASKFNSQSQFYPVVSKRLKNEELELLQMIFEDLKSRDQEHKLTCQNFLCFFNLQGLWGSKLFKIFDSDGQKIISLEEFLYGISRTIKATYEDKVKLLYKFFADSGKEGIKYSEFTKMLYNYSREELKEIFVEDSKFLQSFVPGASLFQDNKLKRKPSQRSQMSVVEVDYEEPKCNGSLTKKYFSQMYPQFALEYGTCLEIPVNDLIYKVKYCNMRTLVQEFARKIYDSNKLNIKTDRLSEAQFIEWIRDHQKLFLSYYQSFKLQLWGFQNKKPSYLDYIEDSFIGTLQYLNKTYKNMCVMLIEDALVLARNQNQKNKAFKIICLEGLTVKELKNPELGYGMEISHHSQFYNNYSFYFKNEKEQIKWLNYLESYKGDTLYAKYIIKEAIGTGKFSIVYRCIEKATRQQFAIKVLQLAKLPEKAKDYIQNESAIMKIISHPQIVRYKETIRTKTHIYIITEYIEGYDLYQYVRRCNGLSEEEAAFIIRKIIEAVNYLHIMEIVHRDIKPQNIMVSVKKNKQAQLWSDYTRSELHSQTSQESYGDSIINKKIRNIQIIDFGLSDHESSIASFPKEKCTIGTPNYIAPELIKRQTPTRKIDIFAIGSVLYFTLCNTLAFTYQNLDQTIFRTTQGQYDQTNDKYVNLSKEAKDLIEKLLKVDPCKRISLQDALEHEWFEMITQNYLQKKEKLSRGSQTSTWMRDFPEESKLPIFQKKSSDDEAPFMDRKIPKGRRSSKKL